MSTSEVNGARVAHAAIKAHPAVEGNGNQTSQLPDWWEECNLDLERFPSLPENWDSYGGAPPTIERVAAAREFLLRLLQSVPRLSQPYISPTPDGGVFLEWRSGAHELEIEAETDSTLEYLYEDTQTGRIVEGTVTPPDAISGELLELVTRRFCL